MNPQKIKKAFNEELIKGTGKAFLIFKRYPKIDFSKLLLEVCLHSPDYDPQCSCSRAQYLYEMIMLLPNHRDFENQILKRFKRLYLITVEQLFDLAVLFAQNGNTLARETIYEKFKKELNRDDVDSAAGISPIIDLDGAKGMLFVAEQYGKRLLKDKKARQSYLDVHFAQERYPKINFMQAIRKAAISNPAIKAYLRAITADKKRKYKRPHIGHTQIKKTIDGGGGFLITGAMTRTLTI